MADNPSGLASIAKAFATYSLVPYLGIIFCPGAVVVGGLGIVRSYQTQEATNRNSFYASFIVGSFVLIVQCLLWWMLYKIPEWAKGI